MGRLPGRNGFGKNAEMLRMVPCTFRIPEVLDKNLNVYALREGVLKRKVIERAIHDFLKVRGLSPTEPPKVTVSY
jgi:hypothetical protein